MLKKPACLPKVSEPLVDKQAFWMELYRPFVYSAAGIFLCMHVNENSRIENVRLIQFMRRSHQFNSLLRE